MAFSTGQASFFTQKTNAAPDDCLPSGEELVIGPETVLSSHLNQEIHIPPFDNLQFAQSSYPFADLFAGAHVAGGLGATAAPWAGVTSMEGSPLSGCDNDWMSYLSLGATNTWAGTTPDQSHLTAKPHVDSDMAMTGTCSEPMPSSAPSVAQGSLVSKSPADAAETRITQITEEDWATHRSTIKKLYMDQNMTLTSTMKAMREKHGFHAKQKCYKEKLKAWGFEKSLSKRQSKIIPRHTLSRLDEKGTKTNLIAKGSKVPQHTVGRHLNKTDSQASPAKSTPSKLSYRILRPDSQSLGPRATPTPPSQNSIRSPSHHQPSKPARIQHQRSHDLSPTNALDLDWHGLDLDALRDLRARATDLAEQGNREDARVLFREAIDGLGSLVGPTHQSTIEALSSFVGFCLSHGFYDEARDKMQKSLDDHTAEFGETHQRTLLSMARLGHFYLMAEQYGNGEIILLGARNGFDSLYRDDPDAFFLNTIDISEDLSELYARQGDFDRSEQEYLSTIARAEALQGPYASVVLRLKHSLAHLYVDQWDRSSQCQKGSSFLKAEQLLLKDIEVPEGISVPNRNKMCSFELLINLFYSTDEDLKLADLLERIEHKMQDFGRVRKPLCDVKDQKLCEVKRGMARSYVKLGNRGMAEWWYLRLQPDLDHLYGTHSREAFVNLMQTALFYLGQGVWSEAEPYFREAQRRADKVLRPDDPVREKIARCLATQSYVSECPCCML